MRQVVLSLTGSRRPRWGHRLLRRRSGGRVVGNWAPSATAAGGVLIHPEISLRLLAQRWASINCDDRHIRIGSHYPSNNSRPDSVCHHIVFILVTVLLFHRTSEWRAKHEKLIIFKERRTDSSKAAREESKFEHTRRNVDSREQKAIEKITKEGEKAKASEQKELTDVDKRLTAQLGSLEKQKQRLEANERTETGRALRANQQQHVANYLNRASISSAKIPGIGEGVVRSLAASGITSAADFTGIRYQTGPRGGQQVYIIKRHGSLVHPTGVGEKKARDLDNWRRAMGNAALATQPSSLPAAQAQAIRSRYAQQRQALVDQERAARAQATNDQRQVRQKWGPMHAAISAEIVPTRQAFAQERVQADAQLTMAQKQVSTAIWQRELAERELAAYRNVNYRRYLAVIIRA